MSTTNKEEKVADVSTENIYRLNGRVPLKKAIPFGLQHVLAMFVSNLAPVLPVSSQNPKVHGYMFFSLHLLMVIPDRP